MRRAGIPLSRVVAAALGAVVAFASAPSVAGAADEPEPPPGALLFGKTCASCHTLGEGDRVGPDLLGVTKRRDKKWLTGFIRNPGAVIDSGDAVAGELLAKFKGVRMPSQAIGDEDLAALFAYFDDCTQKGGCKPYLGKVKPATEATPADIALGRALFDGSRRLAAGGPACASCHRALDVGLLGGGTLAKDLTGAYGRLTDAGTQAALETTPYPLMKDVFAKKKLAADEVYALKAFLWDASRRASTAQSDANFLYLGVAGLFAALGAIGAAWSGRLRGVRRQIVARGQK